MLPFNHNIVTADMMAPSQESSQLVTLPIMPPTPICMVTELIHKASEPIETPLVTPVATPSITPTSTCIGPSASSNPIPHPFAIDEPVQGAILALRSTTAGFLISDSPLKATEHGPVIPLVPISPKTSLADYYSDLLDKCPNQGTRGACGEP